MTTLIDATNIADHRQLVRMMHFDRKRIFVDWKGWDVPHDEEEERDQFDGPEAAYLVVRDPATRGHLASLRLLRTDRPHLLGDIFPELCEGPPPQSARIREITRLCVSPDCPKEDRQTVRRRLVCALAEYALLTGIEGYTMLTEMSFLSRVAALGWRCEMLGMPKSYGDEMYGALMLHVDADTIPALRRTGVYTGPALDGYEMADAA